MDQENQTRSRRLWLIPLTCLLLVAAAWQGWRVWSVSKAETEIHYQRHLSQFGKTELGVPIITPTHFAQYGERSVPDMLALLEDGRSNVLAKNQAMEVLHLLQGERAVSILAGMAENQPDAVRKRAVELLGQSPGMAAVEPLARMVRDQTDLAVPAIRAMGNLGPRAAGRQEVLIEILRNGPPDMAVESALALGRIGTPEALAALLASLEEGRLVVPAARGLARMRRPEGLTILSGVLAGERAGDRRMAEEGLAEAGDAAWDKVESLIQSGPRDARLAGFRILARTGTPEQAARQVSFLADEDPEVLEALFLLLEARPSAEAGRALFAFLTDGEIDSTSGQTGLAERALRQSVPLDIDFHAGQLRQGNSKARVLAARMLAHGRDPKVAEVLLEALEEEDSSIRREAAMSLGRLHGFDQLGEARQRARMQLERMAENDPDEQVRSTARSIAVVLRD